MEKAAGYVPLHLHSEYSLLDGAIKISELVEAAAGWKLPAVAITDHGNLFGAVEFYKRTKAAGIKPIMGCELYVASGSRHSRQKEAEGPFHLVALAKDEAGYVNLVKLVSKAFTEGFYYKPRIDKEVFAEHGEGLIVLSACMKGEVPYYLSRGMEEKAREAARFYLEALGRDNYFIELQDNGMSEQVELNRKLLLLARALDIKVVATNDCHYLKKEDRKAHDILLCIGTGKTVNDPARMRFMGEGLYFKGPEEMETAFSEIPEAIRNTMEIAERCNVEFRLGQTLLPLFATADGSGPGEFFERKVQEGFREKFGENPPAGYGERLDHEMAVIKRMGYESYFLIVWDFVNFAREKKIPVGPGRGSAAGSLVAYVLGITRIDPMRYGLLFERFLNPERVSMPDVDTDICRDRRQEVINYVSERYGREHVAQIITFGTLGAKAAIRDVGRALDIPYQEVDRIAKLVPEGPNISIDYALQAEPALSSLYGGDEKVRELIDIARRLEGLCRHASTHAAGIVISPHPLTDIVPLYKNPTDGSITTQLDMSSIDAMGLVKFDLLGLKTLTIIDKTVKFVRETDVAFSPDAVPLDDKDTFALLGSGQTTGVFQLESGGMRDILVRMAPERFEDLIAINALYRPGPIGSGMIDDFLKRKKGMVPVKYELPQLKDLLNETYGVILYQEQVMQIAHTLAGFSLGQADILRKAMGKKKPEEMEKQKETFIKGAVANRIPEGKARKLFDLMAKFAEYGFNKSHSAAYAYVAYQTAYLKAHYPVEFMAATMSAELDNTDKIMNFIKECRSMRIEVLPPDVNVSDGEFKVVGGAIRFGMMALKGAGQQAIEEIITERAQNGPFNTFEDFLERVKLKAGKVNRKVIEALVKAGAFDSLGRTRKGCFQMIDSKNVFGFSSGQTTLLFEAEAAQAGTPCGPDGGGAEWDELERLRYEKEALGFYISGHPLRAYLNDALLKESVPTSRLSSLPDKAEAAVAGIIAAVRKIKTKGKGLMAAITLDDGEGMVEAVIFPDLYQQAGELVRKDTPVLVRGNVDMTDKGVKMLARHLMHLEDARNAVGQKQNGEGQKVEVFLDRADGLAAIRALAGAHGGDSPLLLKIVENGLEVLIETSCRVRPDDAFFNGIREIDGARARFYG